MDDRFEVENEHKPFSPFCLKGIITYYLNNSTNSRTSPKRWPGIFNTDQGVQFASRTFTGLVEQHQIPISMDGRSRVQDNIFIERLWWTTKYQYLYLRSFDNGSVLRIGMEE
jgi:transposase InsO family protein